jgi:hypothetical protein
MSPLFGLVVFVFLIGFIIGNMLNFNVLFKTGFETGRFYQWVVTFYKLRGRYPTKDEMKQNEDCVLCKNGTHHG